MSNRPGEFFVTVNRYYVTNFRLHKEVYEQFPLFDTDRDEFISMEEYNQRTYDFIHDEEYKDSLTQEDIDHVEASNKRDIRRFLEADGNSDGQLDIVEFAAFLIFKRHIFALLCSKKGCSFLPYFSLDTCVSCHFQRHNAG